MRVVILTLIYCYFLALTCVFVLRLFQLETVESEVVSLREAGAGGYFQAISLPGGMTPSSSDVIASLNEHLVQTLHVSSNFAFH